VNIRSKKHDEVTATPEDTVVVRDIQQGLARRRRAMW